MKRISYISSIFACIMAISSCASADLAAPMDPAASPFRMIEGTVSDRDGNPIEHIKVSIAWNDMIPVPDVKYTDSDGRFTVEISQDSSDPLTMTITMEDIDGEENGGLFETLTDTITLFEEGSDSTVSLDYRLTPSTASESSPQS